MQSELEKLIEELYKHPVGNINYIVTKSKIEDILKEKEGYDKYVICFPSKFNLTRDRTNLDLERLNMVSELMSFNDIEPIDVDDFTEQFINHPRYFSETNTFIEDNRFTFIPRSDAEYDMRFKQLVVACYITDGKEVILLNSHKGRMSGRYTMIQGHVEFDSSCYLKNQFEILRNNIIREIEEEIKTDITIEVPKLPKYFYNGANNLTELEHFGIIYEIRVENIEEIIDKIQSGEPQKHSIVCLPLNLEEIVTFENKLDDWSVYVFMDLIFSKNHKQIQARIIPPAHFIKKD